MTWYSFKSLSARSVHYSSLGRFEQPAVDEILLIFGHSVSSSVRFPHRAGSFLIAFRENLFPFPKNQRIGQAVTIVVVLAAQHGVHGRGLLAFE